MAASESSEEREGNVNIKCPNCNSNRVVVCEDSYGHFQVIQCHNCGYKKECRLENGK